jgi:hypothetical protein
MFKDCHSNSFVISFGSPQARMPLTIRVSVINIKNHTHWRYRSNEELSAPSPPRRPRPVKLNNQKTQIKLHKIGDNNKNSEKLHFGLQSVLAGWELRKRQRQIAFFLIRSR